MDTKKVIEFLEGKIYYWEVTTSTLGKKILDSDNKLAVEIYKDIIRLLQRGEKFEAIVKEIEYELEWHKPEEPLHTAKLEITKDEEYLNEILDMIANIKQKYFPKPIKGGKL